MLKAIQIQWSKQIQNKQYLNTRIILCKCANYWQRGFYLTNLTFMAKSLKADQSWQTFFCRETCAR